MEEYIAEAFKQSYIHPSLSSAALTVFFCGQEEWGFMACIDYRALNHIKVPFVPATLEQLRRSHFTKLNAPLRCTSGTDTKG